MYGYLYFVSVAISFRRWASFHYGYQTRAIVVYLKVLGYVMWEFYSGQTHMQGSQQQPVCKPVTLLYTSLI